MVSDPRAHRIEVETALRIDPAGDVRDAQHGRALRDELLRCDPSDVAEALHYATLLAELPSESLACSFDHHHDTGAGRLVPEERTAERDGLPGDDLRNRMAHLHRIGVHDPGHRLLVRRHVRRRDVLLRPDHSAQLARVAPRQPLELTKRQLTRIAANTTLRATVRKPEERTFPGHPNSERSALAHRHVRVVANPTFGRPKHTRVLNPVSRKDVDVPLVPPNRNRDHDGTFGVAKPLGDRLVDVRVGKRQLELLQRGPKERRIPFEPGFLRGELFDLGHGRSLGARDAESGARTRSAPVLGQRVRVVRPLVARSARPRASASVGHASTARRACESSSFGTGRPSTIG